MYLFLSKVNFCLKENIKVSSDIFSGVILALSTSTTEYAFTVPLFIKRSVENESNMVLLSHFLLNAFDILMLVNSFFSVLKYG